MAQAMQTPDRLWRVEPYRAPQTTTWWYRLKSGDSVVEGLVIAQVERLLGEMGYDVADLQEVGGEPQGAAGAA